MKSKHYTVLTEWDDNFEKEGYISNQEQLIESILNDSELETIEELVFGYWGECYDTNSQSFIDMFLEHSDKFKNVKSLFFGDMDQEDCEISWIEHGDYSKLWSALPNLEKFKLKGANNVVLGDIEHNNLKHLEIVCGGLPVSAIKSITKAKLPKLETLILYLGVEDYGFDGELKDIENLVEGLESFESLKYLGLVNSDMQNHVVKVVIDSSLSERLEIIDFSYGVLVDVGAKYIIENKGKLVNCKEIKLDRSYLSNDMVKKLKALDIPVSLEWIQTVKYTTDEEVNHALDNTPYEWFRNQYKSILEKHNLEKVEIMDKSLSEIDCELLQLISKLAFDGYPLYTE